MDMIRVVDEMSKWLYERVDTAGARGVVCGLSGGIDSACVAAVAKKTFADNMLCIVMPCHSVLRDQEDARVVADTFSLPVKTVTLDSAFDAFMALMSDTSKMAEANVKARLRMITLYHHAQLLNYLVAGTGNKTELLMGYFTKYGDGGVDLLPLAGLYKRDVVRLAEVLGIPRAIIEKPPSAGLWPGQTDEQEMGITYPELDHILSAINSGEKTDLPEQRVAEIESVMHATEHKRTMPAVFGPAHT